MKRSKWQIGLALVFSVLLVAGVAVAQEDTGGCYVLVSDATGARLPGATVTLSGYGAPRVQVTNANGEARYPNLDPGSYQLAAELDGFSSVEYPAVSIRVGRSTTIEITLSEAVEETITVTSESPLLDERRISTGTTVSQVELEKIPTARDPWSILSQTPGVMVDRINVGGNESGQQSTFTAPGVSDDENAFLIDGVETTDMAATGASATYYDFDQFTEMQFTTGGSDVTKVNAGVSVNLVTKRGTNEFRGSARFMRTDDNYFNGFLEQNVPEASQSDLGPNQSGFVGNTINKVTEYGFEAGGPVVKDKFWAWGSFGSNDIKNRTGAATRDAVQADDTVLENTAVKLNAQFSASNSATGSWNNGDKNKFGRNASPTRPAPTTWDQRGPSAIIKFEDSHVFNSNFFLTGTYSIVDGGFSLTCKACLNGAAQAPETVYDENGVWQRSFYGGPSSRPSEEVHADGSYFFNAGSTSNEVKFGARKRHFETSSAFHWPGRDVFYQASGPQAPGAELIGTAHRGETPLVSIDYTSAWVQDTLTTGNLTANFGFRYDLQEGTNEAFAVPANPALPTVMPSLSIDKTPANFDFTSILPRAGITYAVGADKDVLLRASFSQFAEQLGSGNISRTNPLGDAYQYFYFTDTNGNWQWDPEEAYELGYAQNYNPDDPTSVDAPNMTDPGLDPAITSELILGAEWAVLPEFVVGAGLTYRDTADVAASSRQIVTDSNGVTRPVTASDYQPITQTVDSRGVPGIPASATLWEIKDGLSLTGGTLLENTDRNIVYQGVNVNFIKRLSNRWMARGYFNTGSAEWNVGNDYKAKYDPTIGISGDEDGDLYAVQAAGSGAKADVFLESSWQANVNGLYQVAPDKPWGFNIAGNIFSRSGTPLPYYTNPVVDGARKTVRLTDNVDTFRTPNVTTVDLRLEKEFASTSNVGFTFSFDAFNVFDDTTVLQRERNLRLSSGDNLRETLSPRIYRFGVRMSWR